LGVDSAARCFSFFRTCFARPLDRFGRESANGQPSARRQRFAVPDPAYAGGSRRGGPR
jgi:hypothetical protein